MADIRLLLNDKSIARLPNATSGFYLARDTELKGFFVVVGKRQKTFTVQGDLRQDGKRASIRISVGNVDALSTRDARAVAREYLLRIRRGEHPRPEKRSEGPPANSAKGSAASGGITLRTAWARYLQSHLIRKGRSEATIRSYRHHAEDLFEEWLDMPLKDLAEDPSRVATRHDIITKENGSYMANGSMRTLRAIYNHARKTNRELPADNPVNAIDWNEESRRDTGMGSNDLSDWFVQLAAIENPIRREFHLFTLLSGSRPAALKEIKPHHIDLRRRILHIPKPKGGSKRAFDIPLSRQMIFCLLRTLRFGRVMYPTESKTWVFPAASASGHLAEQKEEREILPKWGNDLRQSYRTLATMAGVSEFDARLLMNHAISNVNAGYVTRHKLLEDHLRNQQQAISDVIFHAVAQTLMKNNEVRSWLASGAVRRALLDGWTVHAGADTEVTSNSPFGRTERLVSQ